VLLLVAATAPGCQWLPRRAVEDKPAVEVPAEKPAEEPPDDEPAPQPVEEPPPPPVEEPLPAVESPGPSAVEEPPPAAESPGPSAVEEPPPAAKKPEPPPAEKPVENKVPELDEVSHVEPAQPEPRLLPEEEKAEVTAEALREGIREAERLSSTLEPRELSPDLRDQVESGRAFLGDARKALEDQDLERAGVLIDKCLVLLRDAESKSRV
jgi:hypothetical protein